ncbi:hypothetical protein ACHAXT_011507 [Thalassiosira profunda]
MDSGGRGGEASAGAAAAVGSSISLGGNGSTNPSGLHHSVGAHNMMFDNSHESFLEEMARQECKGFPCKVHRPGQNSDAENEEDDPDEERRRFMLLDFTSDDDDDSDSEDYTSSDEDDTEQDLSDEGNDGDEGEGNDAGGNEDGFIAAADQNANEEDAASMHEEDEVDDQEGTSVLANQHLLSPLASIPAGVNPAHQRLSYLLICLANSEERPLIRADIPWADIISCGSSFMTQSVLGAAGSPPPRLTAQSQESLLQSLYKYQDDPNGARLLQGVLRMDPPLEAVQVLLDAFPLSCVDMEGFFAACQFSHPNTSRRPRGNAPEGGGKMAADESAIFDDDTDDVGEVVKLVMNRTIRARRLNSIDWGMVAFLGDARISPSHAKLLLRQAPAALIDPKHGAFGVSPLDRMASGVFIHGETTAWVEKLRLALRTAAYVRLRQEERREALDEDEAISLPKGFFSPASDLLRRRESANVDDVDSSESPRRLPAQLFYPHHELIRLLISPEFQGNKFGRLGFLNTLKACTQSDPDAFLRRDNNGNLPLHIALSSECKTVLGSKGERRLIKYLLSLDGNMALCPEGSVGCSRKGGLMPLRLSVQNAWPVYDLIIKSAFACCDKKLDASPPATKKEATDLIAASMITNRPLLHDLLGGPYHPRFGIHGARQLVKNTLSRITSYCHESQDRGGQRQHGLANFDESNGRSALHVALAFKWPVYDLLVRANPNAIEARDPTCHGFFPFQVAACAFTASRGGTASSLSAEQQRLLGEAGNALARLAGVSAADGMEAVTTLLAPNNEALETSMLFELIRESPLCVTWNKPTEDNQLHIGPDQPANKRKRTSSPS